MKILNVPEDSEKGQSTVKFISNMLMEGMPDVFDAPPELEGAHRSLAQKPAVGQPPRALAVCFHKFQEREKALQWARTHDVQLGPNKLRIYPDVTAALVTCRIQRRQTAAVSEKGAIQFTTSSKTPSGI